MRSVQRWNGWRSLLFSEHASTPQLDWNRGRGLGAVACAVDVVVLALLAATCSNRCTMNIGILASHFGSTLQAIIDARAAGRLRAIPRVVISNNSGSEALKRAERAGLKTRHLSQKTHPLPADLDRAIVDALRDSEVELVVLAGYMKKLGAGVIRSFPGRILNTHPALLPKHGGQGMYGMKVHEAVVRAKERESGVTIHVVNGEYDAGPIVAQKRVLVLPEDDALTLSERVRDVEREFLVETLDRLATGELTLPT